MTLTEQARTACQNVQNITPQQVMLNPKAAQASMAELGELLVRMCERIDHLTPFVDEGEI